MYEGLGPTYVFDESLEFAFTVGEYFYLVVNEELCATQLVP